MEGLAALYEKYKDFVYNLSFQFFQSHHQAEDIAQEVFVRAFFQMKRFRSQASIKTYLAKITMNLCRDIWRKERRIIYREKVFVPTENTTESEEKASRIREALLELKPIYRQILILKEIEGLSLKEIEEITGKKMGTIKSWLHRGKKKLREALQDEA